MWDERIGGVFPLVRKNFTDIPKIFNAPIDSVSTIVTFNRIPILLAADHIPVSSPKPQTFIGQLEYAVTFSSKHNLLLILAGDINARDSLRGDRSANEHNRILLSSLHDFSRMLNSLNDGEPIFVSTNRSSAINLFITSELLHGNHKDHSGRTRDRIVHWCTDEGLLSCMVDH